MHRQLGSNIFRAIFCGETWHKEILRRNSIRTLLATSCFGLESLKSLNEMCTARNTSI